MLESRRKAVIFLTLAFLFAAVAGYLFLNHVNQVNAEMGKMTTYYVAKKDIAPRIPLKVEDFEPVEIPARFAPGNLVTDPENIEGAVTVVPMAEGDALEKNILKPYTVTAKGANSRLVRLMVSERIAFDSDLVPLDRVDIIVSRKGDDNNGQAEVFMKDVPVATVFTGKPTKANGEIDERASEQLLGIGVDVSLEDARRLIEVSQYSDHVRVLKANIVDKEEASPRSAEQGEASSGDANDE